MGKAFIISLLSLWTFACSAQEPSYSVIGGDELAGVDIYTMIQDRNNFIWLGTDNGILKYDGYNFIRKTTQGIKTNSVFGFVYDNNNTIFGFNLSGQILKIQDDSVRIFYEIPDSLMASYFEIGFDSQNRLFVVGSKPFRLTHDGKPEYLFENFDNSFYSYGKRVENTLYLSYRQTVVACTDNGRKQSKPEFRYPNLDVGEAKSILKNKSGYLIAKERDKMNYFEILPDTAIEIDLHIPPALQNLQSGTSWLAPDSSVWQTTRKGGVIVAHKSRIEAFHRILLFEDVYVSAYLNDHEGNFWLATLGNGILFIPNENLYSLNNHKSIQNEVFTKISTSGQKILLGTRKGTIYKFKSGMFERLPTKQETGINILQATPSKKRILYNSSITLNIFDPETHTNIKSHQLGSLKDIAFLSDSVAVVATGVGVKIINIFTGRFVMPEFNIPENIGRTFKVCYCESEKSIWISTLKGLKIFRQNQTPLEFTDIYPSDMQCINNSVWVATKDKGIYEFQNLKPVRHLNKNNAQIPNHIYKLIVRDNLLFISSDIGIQIIDILTNIIRTFEHSDGLLKGKINDFAVVGTVIWCLNNNGIQVFDYQKIKSNLHKPQAFIGQVRVNDRIKNLDVSVPLNLYFTQNRVEITLLSSSYRHSGALRYAFKLNTDSVWQYKNFRENTVSFSSLQSGNYTFIYKAINENGIEGEPKTFRFNIQAPFWLRTPFFVISGLAIVLFFFALRRYEMRKQRRKIEMLNELNLSKLIAIQSQMNPHFIFNAINSIQDLILKADIDNSYNYVIKLSNLVRKTLNFSQMEFIDIEEETELLGIYLELEKLRFSGDFSYSIEHKNTDDLQVPPMLIQPYAENAIKHGLLHKTGEKTLKIEFILAETLICTISDNGIGRKKSDEIQQRRQKHHQSFSTGATSKRLEIMQHHYKQNVGVEYSDFDSMSENTGTIVKISMPFRKKY